MQAFHRRIFGDVYDWAGEIRTVAIAKGDLFALPEHIEPHLAGVLAHLAREQHLRGLDRELFLDRLTHYLAEINATHPFREGNGRTQRAFVQQLAQDAGYRIDWRALNPEQNINASRAAPRSDNQPLRAILAELITTPEQDEIARLRFRCVPAAGPADDTTPLRATSPAGGASLRPTSEALR